MQFCVNPYFLPFNHIQLDGAAILFDYYLNIICSSKKKIKTSNLCYFVSTNQYMYKHIVANLDQ